MTRYFLWMMMIFLAFPMGHAVASPQGPAYYASIRKPSQDLSKVRRRTCPSPTTLRKVDGKWEARGDWVSDDVSFIEKIEFFLGAQWKGINIGTIICLYTDSLTSKEFPVALHRENEVLDPINLENWQTSKNNKIKFCNRKRGKAFSIKDCKYIEQLDVMAGKKRRNLWQIIRSLKYEKVSPYSWDQH
jgi:hypothetical protein